MIKHGNGLQPDLRNATKTALYRLVRLSRTSRSFIQAGGKTLVWYQGTTQESRMHLANATNLNRESGGPKWRDLRFSRAL
jgi:hypothetical protein